MKPDEFQAADLSLAAFGRREIRLEEYWQSVQARHHRVALRVARVG